MHLHSQLSLIQTLKNFTNPSINFNVAKHFFYPRIATDDLREHKKKPQCFITCSKGKPETQRKCIASTCSKLQLDDKFSSSHDDDANHKRQRNEQISFDRAYWFRFDGLCFQRGNKKKWTNYDNEMREMFSWDDFAPYDQVQKRM